MNRGLPALLRPSSDPGVRSEAADSRCVGTDGAGLMPVTASPLRDDAKRLLRSRKANDAVRVVQSFIRGADARLWARGKQYWSLCWSRAVRDGRRTTLTQASEFTSLRHSRESGNPWVLNHGIPAFAGMTVFRICSHCFRPLTNAPNPMARGIPRGAHAVSRRPTSGSQALGRPRHPRAPAALRVWAAPTKRAYKDRDYK